MSRKEESDLASVASASSSTGSTTPSTDKGPNKTAEELARDERKMLDNRMISNARLTALLIFIICAATVSVAMFKFTENSEQETFEIEVRTKYRDTMVVLPRRFATGCISRCIEYAPPSCDRKFAGYSEKIFTVAKWEIKNSKYCFVPTSKNYCISILIPLSLLKLDPLP